MRIAHVIFLIFLSASEGLINWGQFRLFGPRGFERLLGSNGGNGGGSNGGSVGGWGSNSMGGGFGGKGLQWGPFNSTSRPSVFGRQQQPQQFSLKSWWENHTKGSRGILIWLMPALLSQLAILRTVVPFFMDRLSQYMQPLAIAVLVALTPGKGLRAFQNILLVGAGLGTCLMFRDTYCAGSSWLPLEAKDDSYAVITGATSGLGRAFAQLLYSHGFNLVLIASREQQLKDLKHNLHDETIISGNRVGGSEADARTTTDSARFEGEDVDSFRAISTSRIVRDISNIDSGAKSRRDIIVISVDLSEAEGPNTVLRELRRRRVDEKIDVLINTAEVGSRGALIETPILSLTRQVDLNVRSTIALTRMLAPRMIKRDTGARILLLGNIASAGPGPDVAIYTASKAFISSFASSLRRELLPQGVLVTLAMPGPLVASDGTGVPSSFARASGTADAFIFKLPGLSMSTDSAAKIIFNGLRQGRDVVCPSLVHRFFVHVVARILPPAVTGTIARIAWQPPARWIPLIGRKRSRSQKSIKIPERVLLEPPVEPESGLGIEKRMRRWFQRFWYSPVIDYSAIKKWFSYPFRPKGLDVSVDDDNKNQARRGKGRYSDDWDGEVDEDYDDEVEEDRADESDVSEGDEFEKDGEEEHEDDNHFGDEERAVEDDQAPDGDDSTNQNQDIVQKSDFL